MKVFPCVVVGLPCMKIAFRVNLSGMEAARENNRRRLLVFVLKIRHVSEMVLRLYLRNKALCDAERQFESRRL